MLFEVSPETTPALFKSIAVKAVAASLTTRPVAAMAMFRMAFSVALVLPNSSAFRLASRVDTIRPALLVTAALAKRSRADVKVIFWPASVVPPNVMSPDCETMPSAELDSRLPLVVTLAPVSCNVPPASVAPLLASVVAAARTTLPPDRSCAP